ncbi:flagellar assembly protein FliH [Escherichia sp. E2661]|uniref:flagellar assembly protein FliH n=1 Tax=Escherichia sp. E2661 TaxID=2044459 RepID=UPI001081F2E7|nr:flagellar assembly protein FliH [Escherichia sp. E2661]TGC00610.1 flagellar assembly protein FliH [Escherichia sp. E2661]
MSTSETTWKPWRPDDLLGQSSSSWPNLESENHADVDPMSDPDRQAELARVRQQEGQKGFTQGLVKGEEEGRRRGYEEGLQQGKTEGINQGLAEVHAQQALLTSQFSRVMESFQISVENMDSVIPARLVQLALMAVRTLLGEQGVTDKMHTGLMNHIRTLLNEDRLLKGKFRLTISAEEPEEVRQQLETLLSSYDWELCADPHLLPGGCRISTEEGELDASLETRWQSLCQLVRNREGV